MNPKDPTASRPSTYVIDGQTAFVSDVSVPEISPFARLAFLLMKHWLIYGLCTLSTLGIVVTIVLVSFNQPATSNKNISGISPFSMPNSGSGNNVVNHTNPTSASGSKSQAKNNSSKSATPSTSTQSTSNSNSKSTGTSQSSGGSASGGSSGGSSGGDNTPTLSLASRDLGAYTAAVDSTDINDIGNLIGHRLKYAMDFFDGSSWSTISNPSWFLSSWQGTPYSMVWGVPMLPNSGGSLATGATGAYDSYFQQTAQELVNYGFGNSVIRLGWEFNGGWFPWAAAGQASDFVTYWQHIVDAMRSVPGQHFLFEWNPTLGDQNGSGNLADYYPGDSYVDWIGEDVYDLAWGTYPGCAANWQTMLTESYGLNWFVQFAGEHGKKMTFPEWGIGSWGNQATDCGTVNTPGQQAAGGDDPYFVDQIYKFINSHNFAEATVWDNNNVFPQDPTDYPNATAMFINDFSK